MANPACAVCSVTSNLLSQVGAATPDRGSGGQLPDLFLLVQDHEEHHEHRRASQIREYHVALARHNRAMLHSDEVRSTGFDRIVLFPSPSARKRLERNENRLARK